MMRRLLLLYVANAIAEKSKVNRFVPQCHSGKYLTSEIEEYKTFLNNPDTHWTSQLDHQWGACVMQGHRNHMEDRTVTRSYFYPNLKSFSLYIVFDGHGGDEAVKHAAKELSDFVIKKGESIFKPMEKFEDYDVDAIVHLFGEAFPEWDRELMHKKDIHTKLLDPKTRSTSGCTCTGVLLTPHHIILFNVGDSRTLIINENDKENGMLVFASDDHKPDNKLEEERIKKSGGFVSMPPQTYIPRVNGQLALSRAFGDFQLKMSGKMQQHEQAVIVDPDVNIFERSEATHIVVASDGVYDGLSNEAVVMHAIGKGTEEQRAYDMLRHSLQNESSDNMAAIVIDLNVPAPTDENDPQTDEAKDEL